MISELDPAKSERGMAAMRHMKKLVKRLPQAQG
jgi:hypothetical protein